MNILIYYKFFPNVGGVERVITILANEFSSLGHKVGIISLLQDSEVHKCKIDDKIRLYTLPNKQSLICDENIYAISHIIKDESYEILFNHDSVSDSMKFVNKVKCVSGCKLITLHHGAIYMSKDSFFASLNSMASMKQRILFHLGGFSYALKVVKDFLHHQKNIYLSDKYVCLCDAYRKQLIRTDKTKVIYNPLSFETFLTESEFAKKQNLVLFVGRIDEYIKRITIMLNSWKHTNTMGWNFVIVGDGPDKKLIEDYIKSNEIKNVSMVGFQQPEEYYKKSKIFLMTSLIEGFPMTVSEAKQFGCVPIAMNSFASISECVEESIDGYIVDNNDIKAFTQKLNCLMNDTHVLNKMAHAAIGNSKNRTVALIANQWINLFSSVVNK